VTVHACAIKRRDLQTAAALGSGSAGMKEHADGAPAQDEQIEQTARTCARLISSAGRRAAHVVAPGHRYPLSTAGHQDLEHTYTHTRSEGDGVTSAESPSATTAAADSILQAGQHGGTWNDTGVEHLLGQGGMAAVWAGTNERTGKHVALKVILRSLAKTSLGQGLFHSEVLAGELVKPTQNVVTVSTSSKH